MSTRPVRKAAQRPVVALICVLLLAGCASAPLDRTELIPAPAVFESGRFDPFADVAPQARRLETEILFATDRDPAVEGDLERHYASAARHGERSEGA
jgi:hypothetical protein